MVALEENVEMLKEIPSRLFRNLKFIQSIQLIQHTSSHLPVK